MVPTSLELFTVSETHLLNGGCGADLLPPLELSKLRCYGAAGTV